MGRTLEDIIESDNTRENYAALILKEDNKYMDIILGEIKIEEVNNNE